MDEQKIPVRKAQHILWDVYRRALGPKSEVNLSHERIPFPYQYPSLRELRVFWAALDHALPRVARSLPRGTPITFVGTGESSRRAFYIMRASMRELPELFSGVQLAKTAHISLPFSPHHLARKRLDLHSDGSIYSNMDYLPKYLPEITAELLGSREHTVVRDTRGREYYVVGSELRQDLSRVSKLLPMAKTVETRRNPYYALYKAVLQDAARRKASLVHLDGLLWTPPRKQGGTAWYVEQTIKHLAKRMHLPQPRLKHVPLVAMYPRTRLRSIYDAAERKATRPSEKDDLILDSIISGPIDGRFRAGLIPTRVERVSGDKAIAVVHPSGVIYMTHLEPLRKHWL